ncbi:putative endonuclease [Albidovulum inexpectatum]|uniref:Putative endonuclease n=1 Tax=Albidovulum inexpectatum TaxID=196587 RepID=A0A2S5JET4_9RHOB|nr:putative endonuclease [Albidovulum inexpectatum]
MEAAYVARGCKVLDRRWRGKSGEIDLILADDDGVVFVEVKQASTVEAAAERLQPRQVKRILAAAEEYVARLPTGLATNMRLDLALVDRSGRIELREAALCA